MKNKAAIIFAIYFFFISIGVLHTKHYCGSSVSNLIWGISLTKKNSCGCSHSQVGHKKKCCKSESTWVKGANEISKIQTSTQLTKNTFSKCLYTYSSFNYNFLPNEKDFHFSISHAPPPKKNNLFLLYNSLII